MLLFLLSAPAAPALGAIHYTYTYENQNTERVHYWFSEDGIRIEFEDPNRKNLLFRRSDETFITLNPRSKEALVVDVKEIEGLIRKIKRLRQRMKQLPPAQRRMMEKAMGGTLGDLGDTDELGIPEFVKAETTTWRDRPAYRGALRTGEDFAGTAVVLKDPPLEIKPGERSGFKAFRKFILKVARLSGSISSNSDLENSVEQLRSLPLDLQFRLVKFQSPTESLTLAEWKREEVSSDFFEVPEDYSVRRPSLQNNAMGGPSDRSR